MKAFDELDWIENFYGQGLNLHVEGIDRVRNFTFLWNIFETFACDTKAEFNSLNEAVEKKLTVSSKELKPFVEYFRNRYFDDKGIATSRFEGLKFRTNPNDNTAKAKVEEVLLEKTTDDKEILKALLYIMYRFRNNLFHGGKQIEGLSGQIQNFIVANHLLVLLLETMKKEGFVKF